MRTIAIRNGAISAMEANQNASSKTPRNRGIMAGLTQRRTIREALVLLARLQIFIQRHKERDQWTDISIADHNFRQFFITLSNVTRASHLAQPHKLRQSTLDRREATGVHVGVSEGEVAKRRRFEGGDHSSQESVVAFAGATKGRVLQIDKVPVAEIGAPVLSQRSSLAVRARTSYHL